tara:strand:- start:254 stop:787 length:534 start_codon:yes stop_codon:yes gene_type:complete
LKFIYIFIFFYINFISLNIHSQTIAVVNIQSLIDNNFTYQNILTDIEADQQEYLKKFDLKENEFKLKLTEIEESKLILSENEINLQIENYNNELTEFKILIEEFNFHYQSEVMKIRELILNEIIKLLEKYAVENNIDLMLDSASYLIVSNSLDITEKINSKLNELNLNLEYKNFEKN